MSEQTFPSCHYGPNDQCAIFQSAADVPKGWADHPSKVAKAASEPKKPKAPKEVKEETPLAAARKAYKAKFGKGTSPKWTLDEINAKLAPEPAQ